MTKHRHPEADAQRAIVHALRVVLPCGSIVHQPYAEELPQLPEFRWQKRKSTRKSAGRYAAIVFSATALRCPPGQN